MINALLEWSGIETGWELTLVTFGLIAQGLFFVRWIVQWYAAERRGVSHMPVAFWWISLGGATMLWIYFFFRREPVGLLGQSTGWIIYGRNLWLIYRSSRSHRRVDATPSTASVISVGTSK